jgi:hypothetical protein
MRAAPRFQLLPLWESRGARVTAQLVGLRETGALSDSYRLQLRAFVGRNAPAVVRVADPKSGYGLAACEHDAGGSGNFLHPSLREFVAVGDKFRIGAGAQFEEVHSLPLALWLHSLRVEIIEQQV